MLAPGYLADLNVIDFDALGCASAARSCTTCRPVVAGSMQEAVGYRMTVKSGVVTFEDGESTGALPGELLRGTRGTRLSRVGSVRTWKGVRHEHR